MRPSRDDVRNMVVALFTLTAGLERARREGRAAAALDLLQVLAGQGALRPSDIAALRLVHPSLITRQVNDLEDAGYVEVTRSPADRRSWLVALTPAGEAETLRLQEIGLDRFALFVAGWEAEEVRTLAALLAKLRASMAAEDRGETGRAPAGDGAGPGQRRRRGRRREARER